MCWCNNLQALYCFWKVTLTIITIFSISEASDGSLQSYNWAQLSGPEELEKDPMSYWAESCGHKIWTHLHCQGVI